MNVRVSFPLHCYCSSSWLRRQETPNFLKIKSESEVKSTADCARPAAMADAYSFALHVELEENKVPRLKNKLVKYFQSKKSNGGDCEVDYEDGSKTAVLRFREEKDQKNVLAKEVHQMSLDKGVLKMTVRLPAEEITKQESPPNKLKRKYDVGNKDKPCAEEHKPAAKVQTEVKGGDDEAEDEELCSTLAVIENIPETVNKEFLEMLVENVLKISDSESVNKRYSLEVIPTISSAVVTFKSGEENRVFVKSCPDNKTFKKKGLKVRSLELTKQALVDDVKSNCEDYLRLYFEKVGGEVENVVVNEVEQSAFITFKEPKALQEILKKKHHIQKEEIRVYPFYESLGIALYGTDTPSLKCPADISEPIEEDVLRYLNDKPSALRTIQDELSKHFCELKLDQSSVRLSPFPSLLNEKDAKAIVKKWRDTVRSAFAQALSQFKSLKLQPDSTVWEESETKIREVLLNEDVVVVPDKASGILSVVGLVADIKKLERTLDEVITKITKRVHREKCIESDNFKVSPMIFHILCQDGLKEKLLGVYPELQMYFRKGSPDLVLSGLKDEIFAASKVIYNSMLALKRQDLEIDEFVLDLLKDEQPEKLTDALLKSNGINAAFEITANRVQLLAVSDSCLTQAGDHLRKHLVSQYIDAEDSNILVDPEWLDLIRQFESTNNKSLRSIQIRATGQQVVVSGYNDTVESVRHKLEEFLTQNAEVEDTVIIKPNAKVEYLKKLDTSWLKQMEDKVSVLYKKEAICLSGRRVHVSQCKKLVENFVSSLFFEHLNVPKPGVKTFFQDKEDMYVSSIWVETGCLVQLASEASDGQDDQFPIPVYQLQTTDGVEIAVCKADMCSYPVDVVVNASNPDLKLNGGLSKALLKAAGPQLQVECDKLINLKGQVKAGDGVITGAGGQLSCKKVIHAVGPQFDSTKALKAQALLRKVVKGSLELAEMHGCTTVALPAISRNQGFPLHICAATIVTAVKEHCDEQSDDSTLKKIHLVNDDDGAVHAMEAAVKQQFGSYGVNPSQQSLPNKPPIAVKPGSNPNRLGQVQTKEGLSITLVKGNIENATTEVIVNTVSKDLDLTKGAISNAIFQKAGQKLQQVLMAKSPSVNVGEVIVTEGCNLKSKQVFHAVATNWNNGKGTPGETLKSIFSDCLGKAEGSALTSISLPAIGTGNLGFPKDMVASLMLKEILEFSSKKQPKHLKKVRIILYPGDAKTIEAFCDEFKKQFPNASGGPASTSSPQKSGPFSKVVSGAEIHETKMGSVAVQVVKGDITKETSDVIINSSNDDFSLKTGVSKAILEAAGQAVEKECQDLSAEPHSGMIFTQPGNLKCKKILHIVGRSDPVQINNVVKDALLWCERNSLTSVSFPAIGTGQGNVQAKQVADAMLDAVIDVLSQNTSTKLQKVRIIIFQQPMLKDFHSSMQEREEGAKEKKGAAQGWLGSITSKVKSLFGVSADKPQKEGDFVIEPLTFDPACFHLCSSTQANVDSAKMWLNDLVMKEFDSTTFTDNSILLLSDEDHKQISNIQNTLRVCIRTEGKNGQAWMTIDGAIKNVHRASNEIHELLRRTRDEEDLKKKVEAASTVADWQYQRAGLAFQSFDSVTNYKLEEALASNQQSVEITLQGEDYMVEMPSGPATDSQGCTLDIKRKLKDEDVPEFWDPNPANKTCLAVNILPGTSEHTEVLTLFQASCQLNVLKIERIQNIVMWKSLQLQRKVMEQRNGHQNNVRRLFHGTSEDTINHINEHGFNRSFAGKNAACYGNGSYFAVNASYSASNTYSRPNQNGEKFMYLCQVLTGDFTVGQSKMITPPAKGADPVLKYDSVVDNIANPTMFVIFHDTQAYPEYLITFK
ncbi:poly(ADP-ribose) polymerase family member 14-related sequence 1 isoform X2 [Labrus mixtus]|uniref:poly(ADP-ribose) polymerase family member 14-related sequence 1 isoform X2 n=1 Tax=Labrus mixtus TaxID=508554 RepID=UPI0029BFDC40|nr:poly(ADP-ribose) polymerase family member 14-related sequence 1 isoform X2 [Labrus mixtus]